MPTYHTIIDKLAFGGNGVCRVNGKVCFVPFSSPGDEVRIAITSEKRSYQTGRIQELLVASPHRTNPFCPLFGSCGGCSWQHLSYAAQLHAKHQILAESLWRGGRVPADLISATEPSPQPFSYRSRVQFKVQLSGTHLRIGFFRTASHVVEDVGSGCPIAMSEINNLMGRFRNVLSGASAARSISAIHVDCAENGLVAVIHCNERENAGLAAFFSKLEQNLLPLNGLFLQVEKRQPLVKIFGDRELFYTLPSRDSGDEVTQLSYQAGNFSQVNRAQNQNLLRIMRRIAAFSGQEELLDLYCGNGNFTLPLANAVTHVTGIEEHPGSITSARANCLRSDIKNATFICSDAVKGARRLADEGRRFHTVLLDPPRAGAADAVAEICRLKPSTVLYISCDPSTLARDCGLFSARGFQVVESVPVDMFPQTYHIESVTLLRSN